MPDHPITIEPQPGEVRVTFAGETVALSTRALRLREGGYPPVLYIPRADAAMDRFEPSELRTTCPHKGEAGYFSIVGTGKRAENAIWSYEQPHAAVAAIAGHLAFYPDRVDAIEIGDSD